MKLTFKYTPCIIFILFSGLYSFTQQITGFSLSSCDKKSDPVYIHNRLISKEIRQDTLILKLGLVLNCCPDPKPILKYDKDTLLLDVNDRSEIFCACLCCFEFEIRLTGIRDTTFTLVQKRFQDDPESKAVSDHAFLEELKYHSSKYIFPTPQEIVALKFCNQTDVTGLKTGLWNIYFPGTDKIKVKVFYEKDEQNKIFAAWHIEYSKDGDILLVCANKGTVSSCIEGFEYQKLMAP